MQRPDPEQADLEAVKVVLRRLCGASVASAVFGRTRLRDAVSHHLGCSVLMSELLVDTLIARGFIRQQVHPDGWVYWAIRSAESRSGFAVRRAADLGEGDDLGEG